jgi:hypothetical protein
MFGEGACFDGKKIDLNDGLVATLIMNSLIKYAFQRRPLEICGKVVKSMTMIHTSWTDQPLGRDRMIDCWHLT